jgi:hypothetical protein
MKLIVLSTFQDRLEGTVDRLEETVDRHAESTKTTKQLMVQVAIRKQSLFDKFLIHFSFF